MKYPVFLCREVGNQWSFWCPFCQCTHWHSAGAGHRATHCHSPEGLKAMPAGYILKAAEHLHKQAGARRCPSVHKPAYKPN